MKPSNRIESALPADYDAIASIYNEYIALGNATMEEELKDCSAYRKMGAKIS